ncbi:YdeI/OmpD-associated family protein [Pseudoxanthomonas sp.]|jgi:uncharacterized protein YdeI (YjbR/CyaY-like superfamily)|uniref:YdeI/OmpD-associated family protein n=1 Tax=Pseudoxanthomonas sp. TaxID=1871049 RepID=UPI002E0D15D0|nr:YdeI/OmpD-associated family protein [Pseudoxanthomonas sp.]
MAAPELPVEHFADASAWEHWLERHSQSPGVWLKIAKKDAGIPSVTYTEALDVALCHGWIDGQKKAFDARFFLQRFTPRRARSTWSKINVARIEALVAAGRMRPAGLREVDAAKADGRWEAAYDGSSSMAVPPELETALAKNRKARAWFDALDRTNRYAVCWRVQTAVKPETKRARVEKLVAMLARGEKIHD